MQKVEGSSPFIRFRKGPLGVTVQVAGWVRGWRYPWVAGGGVGEGGDGVAALFACGGEVDAEGEEVLGSAAGAPAAADLLWQLDHADVAFGLVVVERHLEAERPEGGVSTNSAVELAHGPNRFVSQPVSVFW
jgi:hypothetical protein